jgi:8-demethyl-8-alpha-L-rhamnosyltetracenomycin-C 2'-O-methyltransferase
MALISAADLPDAARRDVIVQIGPQRVADIIVDELIYRADFGHPSLECAVEFRFVLDDTEFVNVVFPRSSRVFYARAAPGLAPQAVVTQDLCEAVQAVFGPRPKVSSATQVLRWCEHDDADAATTGRLSALFPQVERLLAGLDPYGDQVSLTRLAAMYGSDKWGIHRYTPHYERYFEPLRDRLLTVLEIGIHTGASLRMWKRFFRRAIIFGLDIVDSSHYAEQRITPLLADQSSSESLERVAEQTGPLDIVIDDGSHVPAHIITSFHSLFPKLRPGGLYIIEDLQTSYWPYWGGNANEFDDPNTSVGFLKSLVDGLNHEELPETSGRVSLYTDSQIRSLHFHHNLVVIEKGSNSEGGAPTWIRKA